MGKAEGRIRHLSIVIVLTVVVTLLLLGGIGQTFKVYKNYTGSIEYCASCHAMELPYTEFKDSKHYKSRSGVSPRCVDCHEDKKLGSYIYQKIMGRDISPEEFESRRMELAEKVWARMSAIGPGGGCRNCHAFENMDFTKLPSRAQEKHREAMEKGKTCTDCHKGMAHMLPEEEG